MLDSAAHYRRVRKNFIQPRRNVQNIIARIAPCHRPLRIGQNLRVNPRRDIRFHHAKPPRNKMQHRLVI